MIPSTKKDQTADHLRYNPLFQDLTPPQFDFISENLKYQTYKKGETISHCRGLVRYTYFIISGKIKLCEIDCAGNELIKDVLKENDFFGDLLPTRNHLNFEYVEVISGRVLICKIPSLVINDLIKNNPNFSLKLNTELWEKYKKIENRFKNVAYLKDVKTRLINFFKDWATSEGEQIGSTVKLQNYLTHKDIASLICSTRVTVTNILNQLREAGDINYSKGQIEIVDIHNFE